LFIDIEFCPRKWPEFMFNPNSAAPVTRRLHIVVNGNGGAARKRGGIDALREDLTEQCRQAGLTATLDLVDGAGMEKALRQALEQARDGEADAVVVGGGDGTIATAAAIFADSGIPLGVLPLGTVNHFAKDIGMPMALEEAFAALAGAGTEQIDVAEVNGRIFTNNSVLGVHPFLVAERDRRQKQQGWSKWPAMAVAMLKLLKYLPSRKLTLHVDDEQHAVRTPLLFVGVNDYHVDDFDLRRSDGMANGHLWLLISRHGRPLHFASFAIRALFTGFDWEGDFTVLRARELRVDTRRSRHLPVTYNGELERMETPLRYRIRPKALTILRPPAEKRESQMD
jgi:diacylglycerol kinase family enzyme